MAQALATVYKQLPGLAKKDTAKLFFAKRDGGFYEDIFLPETSPEQVIAAISIMRSIPKLRERLENSLASQDSPIPAWLLHSDSFMAAMFWMVTGDQGKTVDKDYLLKYAGWVQQVADAEVQAVYKDQVGAVDTIVKKNEMVYGYSHPRFFKTQAEYEKQLRPIATKRPKNF